MSKKRGKKIDTMRLEPYEIDVDIYLSKMDGNPWFKAELGGESIGDTDYTNLRKKINEHARICFAADWKPIIEIHTTSPETSKLEVTMKFGFRRFYYAVVGSSFREVDWDTYKAWEERGAADKSVPINASIRWRAANMTENKSVPRDETRPIYAIYDGEEIQYQVGSYYRPYSEELWAGLVRLRNAVAEVGTRLTNLLGSNEGLARIASGATLQMLTDGQDSE